MSTTKPGGTGAAVGGAPGQKDAAKGGKKDLMVIFKT